MTLIHFLYPRALTRYRYWVADRKAKRMIQMLQFCESERIIGHAEARRIIKRVAIWDIFGGEMQEFR